MDESKYTLIECKDGLLYLKHIYGLSNIEIKQVYEGTESKEIENINISRFYGKDLYLKNDKKDNTLFKVQFGEYILILEKLSMKRIYEYDHRTPLYTDEIYYIYGRNTETNKYFFKSMDKIKTEIQDNKIEIYEKVNGNLLISTACNIKIDCDELECKYDCDECDGEWFNKIGITCTIIKLSKNKYLVKIKDRTNKKIETYYNLFKKENLIEFLLKNNRTQDDIEIYFSLLDIEHINTLSRFGENFSLGKSFYDSNTDSYAIKSDYENYIYTSMKSLKKDKHYQTTFLNRNYKKCDENKVPKEIWLYAYNRQHNCLFQYNKDAEKYLNLNYRDAYNRAIEKIKEVLKGNEIYFETKYLTIEDFTEILDNYEELELRRFGNQYNECYYATYEQESKKSRFYITETRFYGTTVFVNETLENKILKEYFM